MCGIAGVISRRSDDLALIDRMTDTLEHRGPDDRGTATFEQHGVALGMRRLSIIDVAGGHQPMRSNDGKLSVVFNGEIYNFRELRDQLQAAGHRFVTDHSDTEVLVHGYEEWRDELFPRLNGMFALALWDDAEQRLVLARDRFGKKPLYYGRVPDGYVFGSELKALLVHQQLRKDIDPVAFAQYLSFDFVLSPRSMLANVSKLPPGHVCDLTMQSAETRPYWRPQFAPKEQLSVHEAQDRLDGLLTDAVRRRLVSDVPLGLFLSGGLDSTTVGYYMTRESARVQSFSIGFEEAEYDESRYAALAAQSLGTEHHLEVFSQSRVLDLIPQVARVLDEPMGDQSIFPTYLLSQYTRNSVTVALGGDGSDELLMGYRTYLPLKAAWLMSQVPGPLRRGLLGTSRPSMLGRSRTLRRLARLRATVAESPSDRLLALLGAFGGDARSLLSREVRQNLAEDALHGRQLVADLLPLSAADETVAAYIRGYLAEDILVKVDRASMAASLEVRAPFLDPELADFILRLPTNQKLHGLTGKYLLRRLMSGRIPEELISRRKQGFGMPIALWLRESLQPLVRHYLSPGALASEPLLDEVAVNTVVQQHLAGSHDHGTRVWLLLQYAMWKEAWLEGSR